MADTTQKELDAIFAKQKQAFTADRYPSFGTRLERLKTLEKMMIAFREPMREALSADFNSHHPLVTDLFESGAIIARGRYIQTQLEQWMKPETRALNPMVHGSSTARVIRQPKGVVGNISPWNFPVECALIMVNDMFAAGNRVVIKTSEHAPASAEVVRQAVASYFDEDLLAVVTGGVGLAQYFSSLAWDHLVYTGSSEVGRLIMEAAAKNLTPVTLEMGGKNPTIFADDGLEQGLIERFLYFRVFKGGQVCTAPDYVLAPAQRLSEWVNMARDAWARLYPDYVGHPDATGAINEHHFNRVMGYVDEARARGVEVISLNDDEPDRERRQLPMYLVIDPPEDLKCMQEEIFGPVTPVKPYNSIDEAIAYINARPRPLATYLVTRNDALAEHVSTQALSGGMGINVFGFQAAEPALPFGGVGASGIGCHSGYEGFVDYSHTKSIFHCADDNPLMQAIRPPYGEMTQAFADAVFTPVE